MTAKLDAKRIFMMLLLIAMMALAACGGGGDDEEENPNLPTPSITGLNVSVANIGDTVEIYGLNFGLAQESGSASCNGTDFTITAWTDTKITATVPTGMTSGIVLVRQNNKSSTSGPEAQLFIGTMPVGDPLISAINPNYGNTGDEILIIGRNFGSSAAGGTVYFLHQTATSQTPAPVAAEVVTVDVGGTMVPQWTSTTIKVKVPGDTLTAGESTVYVTVGTKQSNTRPFTKLPDVIVGDTQISLIDPANGPVGTTIVITGNGFGFTQGSSTITIGGVALEVVSWDNTEIRARIPSGGDSGAIRLVIGGQVYDTQPFTVGNKPEITGVSPNAIRVGNSLMVYGSYFGSNPGTGSLKVGGTVVAVDDTNWNVNSIYVPKLPKLTISDPEEVPVIVTSDNGLSSEPFNVTLTSDISAFVTVDPSAGEVGKTTFIFTVLATGGSGSYSYELIPDASKPSQAESPTDGSSIPYKYPAVSGFKTTTFKTKVRVTDKTTGDSNTIDGPDVMVVAEGAPVIVNMAIQDFNRSGINAPNDLCIHPSGEYFDFSFYNGTILYTSPLMDLAVDGNNLPSFTVNLEAFMNNGSDIIGASPRAYGYRYGNASTPAPGSYVRLMGLNFGDTKGNIWLDATVSTNGDPSGFPLIADTDILEWSDNSIVFRMPAGVTQSLSGFVALQTSDSTVARSAQPLIASAYVQAMSPDSWQTGGPDTITLSGYDFVPPQVAGITGTRTFMIWRIRAQYDDPFTAGTNMVTGSGTMIIPIELANVTDTAISFPSSLLTTATQIEVMNATMTQSGLVDATPVEGDYYFYLWTGVLSNASNSQIANSGIFSQAYKFTVGAGGGPTTYTISGKITDAMGIPPNDGAAGVTVNLSGAATKTASTAADGTYTFTGLANGNYTVTPAPNATFTSFNPPSSAVVVSGANVNGINFVGQTMPGP